MTIILFSHIINVLVAGSVAFLLFKNSPRITRVYGESTPARAILSSIYFSIAVASAVALIFPPLSITIAMVLFPLQIVYKLSTIITVKHATHPVVLSNIIISVVHALSLITIFY